MAFRYAGAAFLSVALLGSTPATADPEADRIDAHLRDALRQHQDGDLEAAAENALEAYRLLFQARPLSASEITLVERKARSFGDIARRTDNRYRLGDTIHVYYELTGFAVSRIGLQNRFAFSIDLLVHDLERDVHSETRQAARMVREFDVFPEHMFVNFNINLDNIDPGPHRITLISHDEIGGESVPITLDIVVMDTEQKT